MYTEISVCAGVCVYTIYRYVYIYNDVYTLYMHI